MLGLDQQRRFCTLIAVAMVMGAAATAEGAAGFPGLGGSGAAQEAVRQIRMVDRDVLTRWISELTQPTPEKPDDRNTHQRGTIIRGLVAALQADHHEPSARLIRNTPSRILWLDVDQGLLNLPPPAQV